LAELLDAGHPQQAAPLPVESRVKIIEIQLPRANTLAANSGAAVERIKSNSIATRQTTNFKIVAARFRCRLSWMLGKADQLWTTSALQIHSLSIVL
jgi:hypothetical protein